MINYNKASKFANLKYSCIAYYNKYKIKIFLASFIIILFLLTGIFTALKISDMEKALKTVEFSFEALIDGKIYSFSFFVKRLLSCFLVMGLLYVFAMTKFTFPLGYLLIGYRAFMLGINFALILRHMGIGALINCLIIFICQMLQLLVIAMFFTLICALFKEKRNLGHIFDNGLKKGIVYAIILSLLINVLEVILLLLFKASSILIIWQEINIFVNIGLGGSYEYSR